MEGINRGNKLFEGSRIILPEHRKGLLEMTRKEWELKNRRPSIDEQELQEMSYRLQESIQMDQAVTIAYWHDVKGICKCWGVVRDLKQDRFKVQNDWESVLIGFSDMIKVEIGGDLR
jgi:hypothetical protein